MRPRDRLLDEWSGKGMCPVCKAYTLRVRHLDGLPDQMVCACGAAFEVEQDGARIRLVAAPKRPDLAGEWLTPAELRERVSRQPVGQSIPVAAAAAPPALAPLPLAEAMKRTEGLLALGNPPDQIRTVLQSAGATPEQIDAAMAAIEARVNTKREADARYLRMLIGTAALFGVVMMAALIVVGSRPRPRSLPDASASPSGAEQIRSQAQTLMPGLPAELIPIALPTGLAPDFMQATPAVQRGSGPVESQCPNTASAAAKLFGGDPKDWSYDASVNGWTLMTIGPGVPIQVPANMTAGYLIITDAPQMISIPGPATLNNINFIAISCP